MFEPEKVISNTLLVLIVIYFSQDILYTGRGSLIAQISLLTIFILSGFYWIKTLTTETKKLFYKAWTAFLLLNVLGYIFTADFSFNGHFDQLKAILIVSLPFYPFYHFAQRGHLKSKQLIVFFLIMLVVSIAQFYFYRADILSMRQSDNQDVVNNVAYMFVFLIPFLFLFKDRKVISMLLAFIILLFIIQGAKRGAVISGAIGMTFFAYYQLRTINKENKTKGVLLVIVCIAALVYFGYNYYQQNQYLVQRMQYMTEGDSSGRDIIFANLFNVWFNSDSFLNLLFGYGFGSTIFLSGTDHWAHNDWLELLTNFGLLGVSIYLTLFVSATKVAFQNQWNIDKRILMMAIVSIWFFTTVVSMNYTSTSSIFQTIILAYLLGSTSKSIE